MTRSFFNSHTCILVVKLKEVPFLIELVGMTVKEGENGLQLRDSVVTNIHDGRLEGLHYGQRAARVTSISTFGDVDGAVGDRGVYRRIRAEVMEWRH